MTTSLPSGSTGGVRTDAGEGGDWRDQLQRTLTVLERLDVAAVERLCEAVYATYEGDHTVFICGNGGSASTAAHFAQDLSKSTLCARDDPRPLRVIALTENVSALTAWANDHGYDSVFEGPLRALGRAGDLLIAISGSGESVNVLNAVRCARQLGITTFALTGFSGGALRHSAEDAVHVEVAEMETAENAHLAVAHLVVVAVREWKQRRKGRSP